MSTDKYPTTRRQAHCFPNSRRCTTLSSPRSRADRRAARLDVRQVGVGALEHTPADESHGVAAVPLDGGALGGHHLPQRRSRVEDVESLGMSDNDRALDVSYHDMDVILRILREGIAIAQSILAERTAGFCAATRWSPSTTLSARSSSARSHGITLDPEAGTETTTLEATFATCTSRRPPTSTTSSG